MSSALAELKSLRVNDGGSGERRRRVVGCSPHLLTRKAVGASAKQTWDEHLDGVTMHEASTRRVHGCTTRLYNAEQALPRHVGWQEREDKRRSRPLSTLTTQRLEELNTRHYYAPVQRAVESAKKQKQLEALDLRKTRRWMPEENVDLAVTRMFGDYTDRRQRHERVLSRFAQPPPTVKRLTDEQRNAASERLYTEGVEHEAEMARCLRARHCPDIVSPRATKAAWNTTIERLYKISSKG